MSRSKLAFLFLFLAISVTGLAGCDSSSTGNGSHLTIYLTDLPFPFDDAAEANVTIERVELIGADSSETFIAMNGSESFNLLTLQDGVTAVVADVDVPDGTYSQLRVIVNEDASVVMKDQTEFDLKIPSGSQSGIKINLPDIEFPIDEGIAEVTVDFDVSKSFVVRGTPQTVAEITGFIFKPVLKISSIEFGGEIQELPADGS